MEDLETELIKAKIKWLEAAIVKASKADLNNLKEAIDKVEWHEEQIALEKEDLPWEI